MPAIHLRVVSEPAPAAPAAATSGAAGAGDVALVAVLFALNVVPIAGELAGLGRWSPAAVGFATAAALLTGRELWSELRVRVRIAGEAE
jgi:hypothetical protein